MASKKATKAVVLVANATLPHIKVIKNLTLRYNPWSINAKWGKELMSRVKSSKNIALNMKCTFVVESLLQDDAPASAVFTYCKNLSLPLYLWFYTFLIYVLFVVLYSLHFSAPVVHLQLNTNIYCQADGSTLQFDKQETMKVVLESVKTKALALMVGDKK